MLPAALLLATAAAASATLTTAAPATAAPTTDTAGSWRDDPIWHDGLAEKCVYEATRTIYGKERRYLARAYTDRERADPRTTVKTEAADGVEVFKHHWSEIVPTENYDYRFSTMAFVRADDLATFKLTASTQEDCGASFKELWREKDRFRWTDSVYFPGSGRREGWIDREVVLFDALPLVLRDFPFDAPEEKRVHVLPSQKDTHQTSFEPVERRVRYAGKSVQELPIGAIEAHEIDLATPDGAVEARFWFAADGAAPRLRTLVRYEGPQGVTYRLRSQERTAYWNLGN